MKSAFALLISVLALGASLNAQAFEVMAQAAVTPNVITATACNTDFDSAIECRVVAEGFLNTGVPIYGYTDLILAPGACDNAYVYATYPFFFMQGDGRADCALVSGY